MPTLRAAENAAIAALVSLPSIDGEQLADCYRSPAAVDGKTGAPVRVSVAIPIRIRPAGDAPKLVALAQPVNAARVSHVGKVAAGTDIRTGDELRQDARAYRVEGVGRWTNAVLVALSEMKGVRV